MSPAGIPVDLMVPEAIAGPGKPNARSAVLPPHGKHSMRRAAGLEAAMVDNEVERYGTGTRCGRYALAANRAFLSGDAPADLVERLREVLAPTLVVAGAQDAAVGVGPVVAVADHVPRGHATVIDHCGHTPPGSSTRLVPRSGRLLPRSVGMTV